MSVKLKPHNDKAYTKVKEMFEKGNEAAVIHPTGTGKSYIALKLIEDNPEKKIIYLSPSAAIMHQLKKNMISEKVNFRNLSRCTYQKLTTLNKNDQLNLKADIIILDEFHHCGAVEWGKAVRNLIKQNPQAKILGLSATPIRYFDGNIDMAEELFGKNIASEMTFAEALDKGILPEFEYVSAMYETKGQLLKLKEQIESSKMAPNRKSEVEKMFNELAKQLNGQTENLPEILEKHMTNKNGKYIVFCSNIEEMQKRIKEVNEIFGKVNPNIKIYNVSSADDYRENQRVLRRFENDNDESSLKLMFSVNMLNEGYHIPDTDGIIMMRPTKSPTVYMQQIGRALTTCNPTRKPVIIDLVDNFDSIRVIEEVTSQLRSKSKKSKKNKEEKKTKFKIIDYTKGSFEISKKIEELTNKRGLQVSEKIDLFERYLKENPNETIHYDTIFDGYHIGQFLIQIRQAMIYSKSGFCKYTPEDLERMEKLGLLYKAKDTIADKVERLKAFCKKYPDAFSYVPQLRKELNDEEIKELDEVKDDYDYIKVRRSKGKLSKNIEEELTKNHIGGIFKSAEDIEFDKKNKISPKDKGLILRKFGSIDNFRKAYIEYMVKLAATENDSERAKLKEESEDIIEIASRVPLVRYFYLGSSNKEGLLKLILPICDENLEKTFILFTVESSIREILSDRYREVIELKYGLSYGLSCGIMFRLSEDGDIIEEKYGSAEDERKCFSTAEIAEKLECSESYISYLLRYGFKRLEGREKRLNSSLSRPSERFIREYFKRTDIFENENQELSDEDKEELQKICEEDYIVEEERKELEEGEKRKSLEGKRKKEELIEKYGGNEAYAFTIEEIDLSVRTFNILKRSGINLVIDIVEANSTGRLIKLRNISKGCIDEIVEKLDGLGIKLEGGCVGTKEEEDVDSAIKKINEQKGQIKELDEKITQCKEQILEEQNKRTAEGDQK